MTDDQLLVEDVLIHVRLRNRDGGTVMFNVATNEAPILDTLNQVTQR